MIEYYEKIKSRFNYIKYNKLDGILEQCFKLLGSECNQLKPLDIDLDNDIRGFGAHEKGKITINCNFISNNLSNNLTKINCEKINDFIDYFIESVLVHEVHHAYMYYCKNEEYLNYKKYEEDKLYRDRPLEIEADKFMEEYMSKYNGNDGQQIARLLKIMRSCPNGENKQSLICDIIKRFT